MDKRQQQILDEFYKGFFSWSVNHAYSWFITGIFCFVHIGLMLIPFQEIKNEEFIFWQLLIGIGCFVYVQSYIFFNEDNNLKSVYSKIKCLPISAKQFQEYCVKKLMKFVGIVSSVCMIEQIIASLATYGNVTIENFLYVLLFTFLIPISLGIACIFQTSKA